MSAPDLIFLLMQAWQLSLMRVAGACTAFSMKQASAAVLMVLACLHGLFSKGETWTAQEHPLRL